MTTKKSKETALPPAPLTDDQKRLAEVFKGRYEKSKTLPRFKGNSMKGSAHEIGALLEVCKTDHYHVATKTIGDTTSVRSSDDAGECLNMALQQIDAIKPQSYLESMLASQMIQVNEAITKCMGLAFMKDQTTYGKELNANLAIKLQRTFVAQVEALQKLRGNGGQKVTVEHVHVHDGGQAIVGSVNQSPGGGGKNEN